MAGKKKEGLGGLKDTTGGNRREDRQAVSKAAFEPISIDAKNALTVIYMLRSPELEVVLRAVASLEGFARKADDNMALLTSLGIFGFLLPLVKHEDNVVRRFAQKLIGMLSSLEAFREQMFTVEDILDTFVSVLEKETDVVMHEFASLTLAELSKECHAAHRLLQVDACIETLFLRITSTDPDVEKNCLDVMNHLLNDVKGIEVFIDCPGFEMKSVLALVSSSYPVIQSLAIEVLKQLTSWCRDTTVLEAFRDAVGIETMLDVLENKEWADLYSSALDLLTNVVDSPDLCDYLLNSGCLLRIINLLNSTESTTSADKILGVLARMSQTRRGRLALHALEMEKLFCSYLQENMDELIESSALGIANMAQHSPSLDSIMTENPISRLLEVIVSPEKNPVLRNTAAYALNILCNDDKRASEALLEDSNFENLFPILKDSESFPVELCRNILQTFAGISLFDELRVKAIDVSFVDAIMSCLPMSPYLAGERSSSMAFNGECSPHEQGGDNSLPKDTSLQVDALECLSGFLVDRQGRDAFHSLDGARRVICCLRSKYASIREWAGHLVLQMSPSQEFVKSFIQFHGLQWMIQEKNTRYSMPSWETAIEAVLASFLPAKFAFTGRLELEDITQEGFYVSTQPRDRFSLLDSFLQQKVCPVFPIYVANFYVLPSSTPSESIAGEDTSRVIEPGERPQTASVKPEPQDLRKYMEGADRNSLENYSWTGSLNTYTSLDYNSSTAMEPLCLDTYGRHLPDPYLGNYLESLKKRIAKEESSFGDINWFCIHPKLVRERAKIIAEFVADEMSGPKPDFESLHHFKNMHINELKFRLGTSIIPLGFIRMGGYLERAVLFKVLSDRIGFPCALVRGPYGRAWVEIAVPMINVEDPGERSLFYGEASSRTDSYMRLSSKETVQTFESSNSPCQSLGKESTFPGESLWFPKIKMKCFKPFPNNFLKPNAIVDLMGVPGKILGLHTREADEYRGAFLFQRH